MWTSKTAETLPKTQPLPGAVCAQYRTIKGKTYGPYFFRFWREDGRLRKVYVPRSDVQATVEACALWYARKIYGNRENIRIRLRSYKALFASLSGKTEWEVKQAEARKANRRAQRHRATTSAETPHPSPQMGREETGAIMEEAMAYLERLYATC